METKTMIAGAGVVVVEGAGRTAIDRESGSLMMFRRFTVQRPGHGAHQVEVEVSESGTPQHETCDCRGFQFRRDCAHITAVYDAGVLGVSEDGEDSD